VQRVTVVALSTHAQSRAATAAGIAAVRPGAPWLAIASAIERVAFDKGCRVIEEMAGHGIGR